MMTSAALRDSAGVLMDLFCSCDATAAATEDFARSRNSIGVCVHLLKRRTPLLPRHQPPVGRSPPARRRLLLGLREATKRRAGAAGLARRSGCDHVVVVVCCLP
eukprot:TRINITY_DN5754_c0_g1_i1.p3 TRINITY_DN5754_c0_g1~~TRINITY_DN5754_c0_g1_i1.p3  ORF type:complete len:104 (+),score=10.59 TRINITY_DN5754_c0_g1_i1:519-830(+)